VHPVVAGRPGRDHERRPERERRRRRGAPPARSPGGHPGPARHEDEDKDDREEELRRRPHQEIGAERQPGEPAAHQARPLESPVGEECEQVEQEGGERLGAEGGDLEAGERVQRVEPTGDECGPPADHAPPEQHDQERGRRIDDRLAHVHSARPPPPGDRVVGGDEQRVAGRPPAPRMPERVARCRGREACPAEHVLGDPLVLEPVGGGQEVRAGGDHREPDREAEGEDRDHGPGHPPAPGPRAALAAGPTRRSRHSGAAYLTITTLRVSENPGPAICTW
jgi:hypothetical protein